MTDLIKLRQQMFESLDELKGDKAIDMDRLRAKTDICNAIIESAKVEVAYAKVTGRDAPTGFFRKEKLIEQDNKPELPQSGLSDYANQMQNVTVHRIKG